MTVAIDHVCFFSDSKIVSHFPFTCNWQKRLWDNESIIAHFPSNKGRTSDIQILHNSVELHPTPCMHVVYCMCGLGLSHTSKQNVLSLILLISLSELTNQK